MTEAQVINYVDNSVIRESRNQPGENMAHLRHLQDLQRAHIASTPNHQEIYVHVLGDRLAHCPFSCMLFF
jgi:hypothetical protein